MSDLFKWLQFFADGGASGGDGGDGAGTGVTSADAGQSAGVSADDAGQRLAKLGVPKDKIARYKASMERRGKAAPGGRTPQAATPHPSAEATPSPQGEGKNTGKASPEDTGESAKPEKEAFDVDAVMERPEVKARVQQMMADRGKQASEAKNAAQAQLDQSGELLDALAMKYNVSKKDGQHDIAALTKAILADDYTFEDKALESGKSVEEIRTDWQNQRAEAQRQQDERNRVLHERFMSMQQQTPDIQKEYPGYDFNREIGNPEFVALTYPRELGGLGWDARRAFRAVHQDEIEKSAVETMAQKAKAEAVRAREDGQARPRENGKPSSTAAQPRDYAGYREMFQHMTPEQRAAYRKQLRR